MKAQFSIPLLSKRETTTAKFPTRFTTRPKDPTDQSGDLNLAGDTMKIQLCIKMLMITGLFWGICVGETTASYIVTDIDTLGVCRT